MNLQKNSSRLLSRVSTLNEQDQAYNLAAYLIAQLGKNYNHGENECISGKELLGLEIRQIQQLQYLNVQQ